MVEFTFLEVHFDDASFTATKGADDEGDRDVDFEAADEDRQPGGGGGKGAVIAALVGLVFLAVVAYLVKTRFLIDEEEEEYEFDSYD